MRLHKPPYRFAFVRHQGGIGVLCCPGPSNWKVAYTWRRRRPGGSTQGSTANLGERIPDVFPGHPPLFSAIFQRPPYPWPPSRSVPTNNRALDCERVPGQGGASSRLIQILRERSSSAIVPRIKNDCGQKCGVLFGRHCC